MADLVTRPILVVLLCLVVLFQSPAGMASSSDAYSRPVTITSWDGTELAAILYWPGSAVDAPAPAILMTHGWAGSKEDLGASARWLVEQGYVVLAYDSRGFGASGGVVGLNGPDEQADVTHLVTWLAALQEDEGPKVLLDDVDTDDPRIGMFGYSYGGAIQLLAAAQDRRIDAVAPDITWNDLERSLAPSTVVKRGWVDLLFWGGQFGSSGAAHGAPGQGGMDPRLQQWYLDAARTGRFPADAEDALRERSPWPTLDQVTAAVFLSQGIRDTLFTPDEAVASHAVLSERDVPTYLYLHPAGHGHTFDRKGEAHYRAALEGFYGAALRDEVAKEPLPRVQWYDAQAKAFRSDETWPPAGLTHVDVGPAGAAGRVQIAQGVVPTSHTESQQFEGSVGGSSGDAPVPTNHHVVLAVDGPVAIVGQPVVRMNVTPGVEDLTLFFSLVEVSPTGTRALVGNQVTAVRVEGKNGFDVELEVPLVAVVHTLQVGSTLQLRIATSDSAYHGGREVGLVDIGVGGPRVSLPVSDRDLAPAKEAITAPETKSEQVPLPSVALVLAIVAMVILRRRSG